MVELFVAKIADRFCPVNRRPISWWMCKGTWNDSTFVTRLLFLRSFASAPVIFLAFTFVASWVTNMFLRGRDRHRFLAQLIQTEDSRLTLDGGDFWLTWLSCSQALLKWNSLRRHFLHGFTLLICVWSFLRWLLRTKVAWASIKSIKVTDYQSFWLAIFQTMVFVSLEQIDSWVDNCLCSFYNNAISFRSLSRVVLRLRRADTNFTVLLMVQNTWVVKVSWSFVGFWFRS